MVWMVRASTAAQYMTYFECEYFTSPEIDSLHETSLMRSQGTNLRWGPLPPEAFPKRVTSKTPKKSFPDTLQLRNFIGVSDRLREITEEFEPGVHQFSDPVEVRYKDGRASEMSYRAFNPLVHINDTLIIEQSTAHKYYNEEKKRTVLEMDFRDSVLVVDQTLISGRHLWVAPDYYNAWSISDALKKRLDKQKIKKLDCFRTVVVRR
jgi:hypothetical protein